MEFFAGLLSRAESGATMDRIPAHFAQQRLRTICGRTARYRRVHRFHRPLAGSVRGARHAAQARAVPRQIPSIATMTKLSILLLAACAFAQKQPITLETLSAGGRGGGRGGRRAGGPPTGVQGAK